MRICCPHVQEGRNVLHSSQRNCGSNKIPLDAYFNNLPDIYLVLKLIEILPLVFKEEINDVIDFINFKRGEKLPGFHFL
ncbi:hypothetical protein HZS_7155 [Henneguya salminicola]|nr:hypothetical protein HZS_7155 [Henneguya salminicola]